MRHKFRHLLSLLLAVTIILPTAAIGLSAAVESEDNNTIPKADKIEIGETVTGALNQKNDNDVYYFAVPSTGRVSINVSAYFKGYRFYLFDINGTKLFEDTSNFWNSASGMSYESFIFDLLPGNYYFSLTDYNCSGDYSFNIQFTPVTITENEKNNDIRFAQEVNLNETMYAFFEFDITRDNFVFTVPTSGHYYIDVMSYVYGMEINLLDKNGSRIWSTDHNKYGNSEKFETYEFDLEAGTYYFSVESNYDPKKHNCTWKIYWRI